MCLDNYKSSLNEPSLFSYFLPFLSDLCVFSEVFLKKLRASATFLLKSLAMACGVRLKFLSLLFKIPQSLELIGPPGLASSHRPWAAHVLSTVMVPSCALRASPCGSSAEAALHARSTFSLPSG